MDDFICPECGAHLVRGRDDFGAHARSHWDFSLRTVDRIPNSEAQRRYHAIMDAEAIVVEPPAETVTETGAINIIEGDI
jgi:hypothetical protein